MVKKLISLLTRNQTAWKLAGKAILFGAILLLGAKSGFSWWFYCIFLIILAVFWRQISPSRNSLKVLYWIFAVFSVMGTWKLAYIPRESSDGLGGWIWIGVLMFSVLFFILLGLAEFLFRNQKAVYSVFHTICFFLTGVLAFSSSELFTIFPALFLFVFTSLLLRDSFRFFDIPPTRKLWILSVVGGFLMVEVGFFLQALPLGVLNASAILALILFLIRDVFLIHVSGGLNLKFLFRELAFFIPLGIAIFALSVWRI